MDNVQWGPTGVHVAGGSKGINCFFALARAHFVAQREAYGVPAIANGQSHTTTNA